MTDIAKQKLAAIKRRVDIQGPPLAEMTYSGVPISEFSHEELELMLWNFNTYRGMALLRDNDQY